MQKKEQKKEPVESVIGRVKFDDPDNPFHQESAVEYMDEISICLVKNNRRGDY